MKNQTQTRNPCWLLLLVDQSGKALSGKALSGKAQWQTLS
jgi:hypothetical protein